jgi:hypothetical protein
MWRDARMQRQYAKASVVAEAASGLRLNISNDGYAVDPGN